LFKSYCPYIQTDTRRTNCAIWTIKLVGKLFLYICVYLLYRRPYILYIEENLYGA